jgi:hypothetical protein
MGRFSPLKYGRDGSSPTLPLKTISFSLFAIVQAWPILQGRRRSCRSSKRLVQQVKRNLKRFPGDFMFQLTRAEAEVLRSQIATSNEGHGGRRYAPYVFTEQGVAMLSGVLRSDRAITVNIEIMRAFVELRRVAGSFRELQERIDQMELDIGARLSEHDEQLRQIFEALRQLIAPPPRAKRPVGFRVREGD